MSQSTTSDKSDGITHFRATFPVGLWIGALFAVCALTWYFAIPAESASDAPSVTAPAVEVHAGSAG